MLSLLIPAYNFDCMDLVKTLWQQGKKDNLTFEIVVFDDGSELAFKEKNRACQGLEHVYYEELKQNIGRSKIRNLLANKAQFENLIFFDCDSKINQADFLTRYKKYFGKDVVVYGGRSYEDSSPKIANQQLRWLYGKKREEISAVRRNKKPYHSFMSNNFLVNKKVVQEIQFLEDLTHYGHEDSAFSYQCKKAGIKIIHIDNPLEHIGLESADEFLTKSKRAVENWLYLINHDLISSDTRLYKAFVGLKRSRMDRVFLKSYLRVKPSVIKNLTSSNPKLNNFDFYKLGELVALNKR